MFIPPRLPLFLLASLLLLITPGPAVMYIIARSLDQGLKAGLVSVLSIETGNFLHVLAATLGLSALLASSAVLFAAIKYLGAAYLIYLGLRKLCRREIAGAMADGGRQSLRRIYAQGVAVAVLNPKTALFFLAFLPQFADPAGGPLPPQLFLMGSLFVCLACLSDGIYALLAGSLGGWLRGKSSLLRYEPFLAGGIYLALGVAALFTGMGRTAKG